MNGLCKRERNKISASKYRKRRKMYVDSLEDKLNAVEKKCSAQVDQITSLSTENKVLKEQLTFFKNLLKGNPAAAGVGANHKSHTGSALMFVLFSCFLFCSGSMWPTFHASQPLHITQSDDPSITKGPGRVLLSIVEADTATAPPMSTGCTIEEIPAASPAAMVAVALNEKPLTPEEKAAFSVLQLDEQHQRATATATASATVGAMTSVEGFNMTASLLTTKADQIHMPALEFVPMQVEPVFLSPQEAFQVATSSMQRHINHMKPHQQYQHQHQQQQDVILAL